MTDSKHHADRVFDTAYDARAAAHSRLAASWRRSIDHHGLDPSEERTPPRLDEADIRARVERMERFLSVAAPKLDHLFGLVGNAGCAVLLTDAQGVVLDQRCTAADADTFERWGLWRGADWSEAAVGTNGIGTSLVENRQVTIHRDEHFLTRNIAMSCMDTPIYGADGSIVAALDVSSARSDQTEGYNRLIAAMVTQTARQIEADNFRAVFSGKRIIVAGDETGDAASLLAVDADDVVVGATRGARRAFGLAADGAFAPTPATDLFGQGDSASAFERAERAALIRALIRADGNVSQAARSLGVGRATLYRRMKRLGIGENTADLSQG